MFSLSPPPASHPPLTPSLFSPSSSNMHCLRRNQGTRRMYELASRACVCLRVCVRAYAHKHTHTHTHTHTHRERERARMHAHTHTYLRTCVDAGKFLNAEEREAKLKDQEGGPNWQTRNVRRLVLLEALDVHTYVYGDVLCMFGHSQNVWIYVSREGERTFSSLHSTEGEY